MSSVEVHCWNVFWAGTVLAREGHEEQLALAQATALRFGRRDPAPLEGQLRTPCLLSSYFLATGRVGLNIEFAGQYPPPQVTSISTGRHTPTRRSTR